VIRTPHVERIGTTIGPLARMLFRHRRTKRWMRTWYAIRSARALKRDSLRGSLTADYWQAGRSVAGVRTIEAAGDVVRRFAAAAAVPSPS
jgi:nitronate monooxygenase